MPRARKSKCDRQKASHQKSPCQRGFFEMHTFSGITGFLASSAAVSLPAAVLFPFCPLHKRFCPCHFCPDERQRISLPISNIEPKRMQRTVLRGLYISLPMSNIELKPTDLPDGMYYGISLPISNIELKRATT